MITLNEYLDIAIVERRVVILVAGEEFKQCAFLVATVDTGTEINSIDELAAVDGARVLENDSSRLSLEEQLWGHASNLQAWIENDYDTRILHSNLSFPLLRRLAKVGDKKAARVLEAEELKRARDPFFPVRLMLARTTKNANVLSILARDEDSRVRMEVFIKNFVHSETYRKKRLAENPRTPPEVLARLAGDEKGYVREYVGGNPSTPRGVLARLAGDEYWVVRLAVAGNPSTPPGVLARLAGDMNRGIRVNVSYNPSTPPYVLSNLAGDEVVGVRLAVARNPHTPPEVLARLATDGETDVRWMALKKVKTK